SPRIVIVDSFRTLMPKSEPDGSMSVQEFVQRLAMKLTTWQATTFLLGEYPEAQIRENPVFTLADGLVVMTQRVNRNSMVRQAQGTGGRRHLRRNDPQVPRPSPGARRRSRRDVPTGPRGDRVRASVGPLDGSDALRDSGGGRQGGCQAGGTGFDFRTGGGA